MSSLWASYWKILKLDPEPFEAVKQAKDGFWLALKLLVVVSLIAGLGKLAGLGRLLERPTLADRAGEVALNIETTAALIPLPRLADQVATTAGVFRAVEEKLANIQPPLGVGPSRTIRLFGNWLATPFEIMATWLGFMLVIWLFARLMGGQGSLAQHIRLLLLAVAPQVLTLVNYTTPDGSMMNAPLGILGRILSLIALAWSLIIAVHALAVAHEIEHGQAVRIFITFALVVFVALPILGLLTGVYILDGLR